MRDRSFQSRGRLGVVVWSARLRSTLLWSARLRSTLRWSALLGTLAFTGTLSAQAGPDAARSNALVGPTVEPAAPPAAAVPSDSPAQATPAATGAPAPAESTPPGYLELVSRALEEYDSGNYAEARGLLVQAHDRFPNARTLRALGMVEFELRHYAACVTLLREALDSSARPLDTTLRAETESLLQRANGFVARVQLSVEPKRARGPRLNIDGVPAGAVTQNPLLLDVGDHVVEVDAPGFAPARRALKVFGGEARTLSFELEAEQARVPLRKKWWVWTVSAGVVAVVATATAIALTRGRDESPRDPIPGNFPGGEVVEALVEH